MSFAIIPTRKVSLAELLARQDQERGLTPMRLEVALLLERIQYQIEQQIKAILKAGEL